MAAAHAAHAALAALVIAVAHVVLAHVVVAKAAVTTKPQFAGPPIKVVSISIFHPTKIPKEFIFHWTI
jgi:hypothetical protein